MKNRIYWLLATIAIVIFYQMTYGFATLLPSNINWLMSARHDWGGHYLAWAYYKGEPWHFPLGRIDTYNYPLGTNVGFADSIPLMAIFFKLFRHWLPADFQYFGLWLFLCFLLAAYFGILLLRRFKVNWFITLVGSLFIALNPVLIYRGMHPALSAHWLMLACIYVYFLDAHAVGSRRILVYQLVLLILSALINPYLCWLVLGFTLATPLKLWFFEKNLSLRNFLVYLAVSIVALVFVWYLVGFIQFNSKEDLGVGGAYGLYAMNLNSLWNPAGYSAFLPQMPWVSWHQYEGYMYLGVGVFVLLFIVLFWWLFGKIRGLARHEKPIAASSMLGKKGGLIPLLLLALVYAIFATTLVLTYNDKVLVRIPAPGLFIKVEEIFRACGRFFWLPYYLIILFAIIRVARIKINSPIPAVLVTLAFMIQVYDIKMMFLNKNLPQGTYTPPMEDRAWMDLMRQFDEVIFLPPFQTPAIRPMDYQDFSYLALKAGKPINVAYVPRADYGGIQRYRDSVNNAVAQGRLSPKVLYITGGAALDQYTYPLKTGEASLHSLDNCFFLVSKSIDNPQLDALMKSIDAENKDKLDSVMMVRGKKKEFAPLPARLNVRPGSIHYNLEAVTSGPYFVSIHGWVVRDSTRDNTGDSVFFTLDAGDTSYWASTGRGDRPDVAAAFPGVHVANAGVSLMAFTDSIPKGNYQLGITVKTTKGDYFHQLTNKRVTVGVDYAVPIKLTALPPESKIMSDLTIDDRPTDFVANGWAALPDRDATKSVIQLILKSNDATFAFDVQPTVRKDVTDYFKHKYQLDNSGYQVTISKKNVPVGTYRIGFLIKDAAHQDAYMMLTDHQVDCR